MAWPFSRRTTYVPSSTPSIKADDLNALQDAIIKLFGFAPFFGAGGDGALASAVGTTSLSTTKEYTTVSLSGTAILKPQSMIVRASQYIQLRGTSFIDADGAPGVGQTHGNPGGGSAGVFGTGGPGGDGGPDLGVATAGTAMLDTSLGGGGGAGGAGDGPGGAGAAGGAATVNDNLDWRSIYAHVLGQLFGYNGSGYGPSPIQGGGGGGGGGYIAAPFDNPGLGGGGAGGVLILCAPVIDVGSGCGLVARGGAGASNTGAAGDFGGGGGGGGGGAIILICSQLIETGLISVAGGVGGVNAGSGGANGGAGNPGKIFRHVLFP